MTTGVTDAGARHASPGAPRVLVVDDDHAITTLLATVLRYEGFSVEVALTGAEALARASSFRPHVVLLDVMLPDQDGHEVHRSLVADDVDASVLYVTARGSSEDRVRGMSLGAAGYVTKPFDLQELVDRVRLLLRPGDGGAVLSFADLELDAAAGLARRGDREIELTPTEARLLAFLMRHPRRVLSRDRIMEHLGRPGFDASSDLVETCIARLRSKIDASEPPLIHTIRGVGYSLRLPRTQSDAAALDLPGGGVMATEKRADVTWRGDLATGRGTIERVGSGVIEGLGVSWPARTGETQDLTSPEELIAAAHASCFSMALAKGLADRGHTADRLLVTATVSFVPGTGITRSALDVTGVVPGIEEPDFVEAAEAAKEGCPVSQALKGNVELTVAARLA